MTVLLQYSAEISIPVNPGEAAANVVVPAPVERGVEHHIPDRRMFDRSPREFLRKYHRVLRIVHSGLRRGGPYRKDPLPELIA